MIGRSVVSTYVPIQERRLNRRGSLRKRRDFATLAAAVTLAVVAATTGVALGAGRQASGPVSSRPAAVPAAPPPLAYSSRWLDANPAPSLGVRARAGILVDLDRRTVLWSRSPSTPRAPASLTKMMTAMVALDIAGPGRVLRVSAAAAAMPPDRMGLAAGERVSVRDLLYGLFLVSGNDAAEALADGIVRPDRFVTAMNAKAGFLRLAKTHFVNATGLDASGHLSSAYDLAVIGGWLEMHYPLLAQVAATKSRFIPATSTHRAFDTYTLNKLLAGYPGAEGLKTGFTDQAGGCLVATAVRGGHHLLAVVLGSGVFFTDAGRLLDYGFSVEGGGAGPAPRAGTP